MNVCITNRSLAGGDLLPALENVCRTDVDLIILREKDLSEAAYVRLAVKALEMAERYGKQLILHTFTHAARLLDHPHIHLSMQDFLSLTDEEKAFFQTIGVSTHSLDEALACQQMGASYITASHIFETKCKEGLAPRGLAYLKEVCDKVSIPVYALGGIHEDNAHLCFEAGADGICMMSDYMQLPPVDDTADRYGRQFLLKEYGHEGQEKLKQSKVLVVGAGGLGSPVLMYLAGAGVSTLGIADADVVSISNLPRQIIHDTDRVGINKAESAKGYIHKMNPHVKVHTYPFFLTEDNIEAIVKDYDFVIDCVDNFEGKFLINDTCVHLGKAFCHAGVIRFEGQILTYVPGMGPCYRCIFEDVPEDGVVPHASQVGIIGPAAGMIGAMQAMEAIKYLTGIGELLTGKMFIIDLLTMKSRIARFPKAMPGCKACDSNEKQ